MCQTICMACTTFESAIASINFSMCFVCKSFVDTTDRAFFVGSMRTFGTLIFRIQTFFNTQNDFVIILRPLIREISGTM